MPITYFNPDLEVTDQVEPCSQSNDYCSFSVYPPWKGAALCRGASLVVEGTAEDYLGTHIEVSVNHGKTAQQLTSSLVERTDGTSEVFLRVGIFDSDSESIVMGIKHISMEVYNNKGVNIKYLDLTWVGEEEPVEMWTQRRHEQRRLVIEEGAVLVPKDPLEVEFRGQKITIDKPTPFPEGELKLSGPVLVETLIN